MSFLEIFQPGLRHLRQERDRQRLLVAHPTHGGNPPMIIDLDAGTATIALSTSAGDEARSAAGQPSAPDSGPDSAPDAAPDSAPDSGPAPAAGTAPPSTPPSA